MKEKEAQGVTINIDSFTVPQNSSCISVWQELAELTDTEDRQSPNVNPGMAGKAACQCSSSKSDVKPIKGICTDAPHA